MPWQLCSSLRWKRVSGPKNPWLYLERKGKGTLRYAVRRKHLYNVSSNLDLVAEDSPDQRVELIVGQVGMN